MPQYYEVFVGIKKFNLIRVDFAASFDKNYRMAEGFRIGLGF
jgi:hypothetical protein